MKRGLAQEFSVNLNALCTTHMMTMNASEIKNSVITAKTYVSILSMLK
jgi:hypothetical protein